MILLVSFVHARPENNTSPLNQLKTLAAGHEPTRLMILGVFHIREMGDRFHSSMMQSLISKLEHFKPDLIAVEVLSGDRIHELELRSDATAIHQELLNGFASIQLELGHPAQEQLGLGMIQAARKLGEEKWGDAPRTLRHRALLNLAAYELPSALLCWSYLPAEERIGDELFPEDLAEKMNSQLALVNEVRQLAIPLARELGHRQIVGVDEFEDSMYCELLLKADVFNRRSPLFKEVLNAGVYMESKRRKDNAVLIGDLLPAFAYLNTPEYAFGDVGAQWGVFLRTRLRDESDRSRLALWENRNLKIAANIRAITSRHPGKRVLVIYGAAHRPFLEAYLRQCSDIEIVQFHEQVAKRDQPD